jgi:hypothetical protein
MTIVAVAISTMSLSQVDSLQNAIVDSISGTFLRKVNVNWIRLLVLLLNIPVIVLSMQVRHWQSHVLVA